VYIAGRAQELRPMWQMHLLTKPFVLVAAALVASTASANTIECQAQKGAGYPWAWRTIDGKQCWYKGAPGMDKSRLQWAGAAVAAKPSPKSKRARPAVTEDVSAVAGDTAERGRLLQSYWPPLPQTDVFGERFEAVRGRTSE
jgi:hypothetical protein